MKAKVNRDIGYFCLLFSLLLIYIASVIGTPVGPVITYLDNKTKPVTGAAVRNQDERGTITVVELDVLQQSLYWKAYVGNVTGRIVLEDNSNYSIYDWMLSSPGGEVYATRKSTAVTWLKIMCAQYSDVENETIFLNHTLEKSDTLNHTFINTTHTDFYVGESYFPMDSCNHSIYTYVNNSAQSSDWVEVLLYDNTTIVYTTILNNSVMGYDEGYYDFQMLVGEKGQEGSQNPIPYYFYVELT
jgi:hypothetical protein